MSYDTTIEKFEHAGLTVRVGWEEDGSFADPRDCDNLGTMVCWHTDYSLGDFQITDGSIDGPRYRGRGAVDKMFQRDDFKSMEQLYRYLGIVERGIVILPLYLYEHSGISISAGSPNPFDNPRVRSDHHGNGLGFDTSFVGYIYTTAERVNELCGAPDYKPRDYAGTFEAWIEKQLEQEVETYDQFLRGEVYWYAVYDADGEILDSCGGFLGGGIDADGKEIDAIEYVTQEAREAAESCAKSIAERKQEIIRGWALARCAS